MQCHDFSGARDQGMSKTWRIVIVVGILGLGIFFLTMVGHRSASRQRLQKYKAELQAKGEMLTFRELTAGQTPNTNQFGFVLTNALAKMHQPRLVSGSLAPGNLELRKFTTPGHAAVAWKQAQLPWNSAAVPTARSGWEDLAREMEAVKLPLEEIRKAAEDPAAGSGPSTNLFAKPAINFVALRTASQWLMGAAICELHAGRTEEALKNLEALAAMARVNREEYFLVSQMIRVAITGLGVAATWEALAADGWTDAQLERLQKAWEGVPLIEGLERGITGERALGGDLWELLHDPVRSRSWKSILFSQSKPGLETFVADNILFPIYKFSAIDDDELFHLTTMQEAVNAVRLVKISVAFGKPASRLQYWFSGVTLPNCARAVDTALRNETERQLLLAAIAIKRYELRHGHGPANLDALAPEFLATVPYDPMSGKGLGYGTNAEGGFVLYSVGEDGMDDGGSVVPLASTNKFGIWETKDAVWPMPSSSSPEK
jgi:type II secretory pathway pseudopilin PulG